MRQYTVCYLKDGIYSETKKEVVTAKTSAEAYKKFMDNHNWSIYSAWVHSFTTQRGDIHLFNNFDGKAY